MLLDRESAGFAIELMATIGRKFCRELKRVSEFRKTNDMEKRGEIPRTDSGAETGRAADGI